MQKKSINLKRSLTIAENISNFDERTAKRTSKKVKKHQRTILKET